MKTQRIILTVCYLILVALTGCGGSASAPPVDLPAPITGRIDVAAPDSEGNVTVTGTEGAVTGDSLVLVINETATASASISVIGWFVKSSYASETMSSSGDYPATCYVTAHACAMADSTGAFVVTIAASASDSLSIGIIDEITGEYTSETATVAVSQSSSSGDSGDSGSSDSGGGSDSGSGGDAPAAANCSAYSSVTGTAVDVALIGNVPLLLKQGSSTTTNQLVMGSDSATATTTSIDGCYAHSLAVYPSGTGYVIAASSKDDKKIWVGTYSAGSITATNTITTNDEPMDITFVDAADKVLVGFEKTGGVEVRYLSTSSATESSTGQCYPMLNSAEVTGLTRVQRVDTVQMTGGGSLMMFLSDDGASTNAYITICSMTDSGLTHKYTKSMAEMNFSPVDADIWYDPSSNYIYVSILETLTPAIVVVKATYGYGAYTVDLNTPLSTTIDGMAAGLTTLSISYTPTKLLVSQDTTFTYGSGSYQSTAPTAIVSDSSGVYHAYFAAYMSECSRATGTIASGASIVGIAAGATTATFADATNGVVVTTTLASTDESCHGIIGSGNVPEQ